MHIYLCIFIFTAILFTHLCTFIYAFSFMHFYTYLYLMLYNLLIYAYSLMLTDTYCKTVLIYTYLFVCVEVLRPSQPNGVMLSTVRVPSHTFTGQA